MQDIANHDLRGWGADSPTINGGQMGQIVITLDGVVNMDSGYGNVPAINVGSMAPSTDAIAEVKLLVSNYTAEYGARNGGQLNVTIKKCAPLPAGHLRWRLDAGPGEFFNNHRAVKRLPLSSRRHLGDHCWIRAPAALDVAIFFVLL